MLVSNNAYAATINCAGVPSSQNCLGSPQSDNILGDIKANRICGQGGNDYILGRGGNDFLRGNEGNDRILGADGGDQIIGDNFIDCPPGTTVTGADILQGGPGEDIMFHGNTGFGGKGPTDPDGFKDIIDCGPGDDRAFINTATDGDVAMNCEHVNP
jgi:Ca2+-binding RTX toxin-like protein